MNQQAIFPQSAKATVRTRMNESPNYAFRSPQSPNLQQQYALVRSPQVNMNMSLFDESSSKAKQIVPFRRGPVAAFHLDQSQSSSPQQHNYAEQRFYQSNQIFWNQKQQQPYLSEPQPVQNVFQFNLTVKKPSVHHSPGKIRNGSIYQSTQNQPYKRRPHSGALIVKQKPPQQQKDSLLNQTGGFSSQGGTDHKIHSLTEETYSYSKAGTNKKPQKISKILPIEVKQSKEDLYEKALTAQIKVNELTEENRKLQTRLQFMETQMGLQDSTGQVSALKRQIKDLRVQQVQLEGELDYIKHDMQYTSIKELRTENELYNSELIRLRQMCHALMQNQSGGVQSGQNKVDLTLELHQAQEKTKALQSQLTTAKNKINQFQQVQQDFKTQQNLIEDQVESLTFELEDQKKTKEKLTFDHSNALLLQKSKYEDELKSQQQSLAKKISDLESKMQVSNSQLNKQLQSTQEERDNTQEKVDKLREAQLKNVQSFKDQIKTLEDGLKEEKNKNKSLKDTLTALTVQADLNNANLKEAHERCNDFQQQNEALKHELSAQPRQSLGPAKRFSETFDQDRCSSIQVESRNEGSQSYLASQEIIRQVPEVQVLPSVESDHNYDQSVSSENDANYRRSIDSDKVKADVKNLLNDQQSNSIESKEDLYDDHEEAQECLESTNEVLTAHSAPIKDALFTMKRACQVHALKFEEIDTWLFGSSYRIEQRVTLEDLSSLMREKLRLQSLQANLFARFLVEQCNQNSGKKVTSETKVLACKVVSTMMSNLNVFCNGIQHYSKSKVQKMQLIIGEHLLRQEFLAKDFDDFGITLNQFGMGKETLDCAHIHLLKLSDSYQRVNNQVLMSFIQQCRNQAKSFSATGMSFPVQEELLEYSISEQSEKQHQQPQEPEVQDIDYEECEEYEEDLDFERMDSAPLRMNTPEELKFNQLLSATRVLSLPPALEEAAETNQESERYSSDHSSRKHVHFNQDECDLTTAILNSFRDRIQQLIDSKQVTSDFVLWQICQLSKDPQLLQFILRQADPTSQDDDGRQALHLCAGNHEMLSVLFDHEPQIMDLDHFDNNGETPLMMAVRLSDPRCVQQCLENSCNPFLVNGNQQSVLEINETLPEGQDKAVIQQMIWATIQEWLENLGEEGVQKSIKLFKPANQTKLDHQTQSKKNIELPKNDQSSKKVDDHDQHTILRLKSTEEELLQEAIKSNDFSRFVELIEGHYPCEDALIKVCKFGNDARFIKHLVDEFDFDMNYQDSAGLSGLHHACTLAKTKFVTLLLDQASIDQDLFDNKGWTPLMHAVTSEQIETVAECLNHGCNPLLENGEQMCAMQIAKNLPHLEKSLAIKILLEETILSWVQNLGTDQILRTMKSFKPITKQSKHTDPSNSNSHTKLPGSGILKKQDKAALIPHKDELRKAIEDDDVGQVRKLLQEGYPSNDAYLQICLHSNDLKEMLDMVLDFGVDVNFQDAGGRSGLHHSCANGQVGQLKVLFAREDINVDLKDKHEDTPLMLAVLQANVEAVTLCINNGCNPFFVNKNGDNVFDQCCDLEKDWRSTQIVEIIKLGMDQWLEKFNGDENLLKQAMLHSTESPKKLKASDSITKLKIDVSAALPKKKEALTVEAQNTVEELVVRTYLSKEEEHLLLKDKLLCAIHDEDLETVEDIICQDVFKIDDVLLWVCQYSKNSYYMLDLVLQYEPNINAQDMSGRSALHLACIGAKLEFIETLLALDNIDKDLHDNGGETPLMYAVKSQCEKAVAFCISNMCNPFNVNYLQESATDYTEKFMDKAKSTVIYAMVRDAAESWIANFTEDAIISMMRKPVHKDVLVALLD